MSPCAAALLEARRTGQPASIPPGAEPRDATAAIAIQDDVAAALLPHDGPIVAWKVGADSPDAEPSAAPIHAATLHAGRPGPSAASFRLIGVEAELAYRFKTAPTAGTIEAIADALDSVHVAIEILDTRFAALPDPLLARADQNNHGALILGPGRRDWRAIDPLHTEVTLTIAGRTAVSHKGGNAAGDPLRLLAWLAPHAARRGHPLTAGTIVTTGSTTGTLFVAHGTRVEATFTALGTLSLDLV
jgi:2-keto-4-pentenoate hydratase